MLRDLFVIATAIVGMITLMPENGIAQEVPKLKQGMPYGDAREVLIDAGWQALEIPFLQREEPISGTVKYIANDLGYAEVTDCAGTGLGLCRFEFAAADGRKLIVVTADNDSRSETPVTLYRWWVEK